MKRFCKKLYFLFFFFSVLFTTSCAKDDIQLKIDSYEWVKIESDSLEVLRNGVEIYIPSFCEKFYEDEETVEYAYNYGLISFSEDDFLGMDVTSNSYLDLLSSSMIEGLGEIGATSVKEENIEKTTISGKQCGHLVFSYEIQDINAIRDVYVVKAKDLALVIVIDSVDRNEAQPVIKGLIDKIRINDAEEETVDWIECKLNTYSGDGYQVFVPNDWNISSEVTIDNSEVYLTGVGYLFVEEIDGITGVEVQDQLVIDATREVIKSAGLEQLKFDIEKKTEIDNHPAFMLQASGKAPEGDVVIDCYIFKAHDKIVRLNFYTFDRYNASELINSVINRIEINDEPRMEDVEWVEYKDIGYVGDNYKIYIPSTFTPSYYEDSDAIISYDFPNGNMSVVSFSREEFANVVNVENSLFIEQIESLFAEDVYDKPKYTVEKNYPIGNTVGVHIRVEEDGENQMVVDNFVTDLYCFDSKDELAVIAFYAFNRYDINQTVEEVLSKVKLLDEMDNSLIEYNASAYESHEYKVYIPRTYLFEDGYYFEFIEDATKSIYIAEIVENANINDPEFVKGILNQLELNSGLKPKINRVESYNGIDFWHLQFEGTFIGNNDIWDVYHMNYGKGKVTTINFIQDKNVYNRKEITNILENIERR